MTNHTHSDFAKTTKRQPCPICGKPDWCSVAADGSRVICMRVSSDRPTANGGYTHFLNDSPGWKGVPKAAPSPPVKDGQPKASVEHHHKVYSALLDALSLAERHRQNLTARGLSAEAIAANGYKSLGTLSGDAFERLSRDFDLAGVAGFYLEKDNWQIAGSTRKAGFFVPYRNENGQIVGLQIRSDQGAPRYLWLSSKDKDQGAGSGTPEHFVKLHRARQTGEIIITEGALKADVIAHRTDSGVCALAGVVNWSDGLPERLVALGVEKARIAFDSDFLTNEHVLRAINKLGIALMGAGIKTSVITWPPVKGKGLDDFLAGGRTLGETEEISFLDWRQRFEPPFSTRRLEHFADDSPEPAQTIDEVERGSFHDYAEIAALLAFMMNLRGFSGQSQRFVENVIKHVGVNENFEGVWDLQLAEMSGHDVKTIRNWRKTYIAEANKQNCSLIEIAEGQYMAELQKYSIIRYRINPILISTLEAALADLYKTDGYNRLPEKRRQKIEQTAAKFLDDLPGDAIRKRRRNSKRGKKTLAAEVLNDLEKTKSALHRWRVSEKFANDVDSIWDEFEKKMEALQAEYAEIRKEKVNSMLPRKEEEYTRKDENVREAGDHPRVLQARAESG